MLFNGERFRKNRLTAAAFLYVWLVITILVGVGQFFYYTSDKQLREVNKQVKISTYVAFTFDYVGSGNLIKVKPFGTRIDSSKWLSILENKSPQEYAVLKNEWAGIVCSPGISTIIVFLMMLIGFIKTKIFKYRKKNDRHFV